MTRHSRARAHLTVLTASLLLVACSDDDSTTSELEKAEVDRQALQDGAEVTISNGIGTVSVPFAVSVPVGVTDFEDELDGAVSLVVSEQSTGASVDLASGSMVSGSPSRPGEWSWDLNSDRDRADLEFYNESEDGAELRSSGDYSAMLSISRNEYIETESAFTFSVDVVGN